MQEKKNERKNDHGMYGRGMWVCVTACDLNLNIRAIANKKKRDNESEGYIYIHSYINTYIYIYIYVYVCINGVNGYPASSFLYLTTKIDVRHPELLSDPHSMMEHRLNM